MTAYFLTVTSLMLMSGRLRDVIGYRGLCRGMVIYTSGHGGLWIGSEHGAVDPVRGRTGIGGALVFGNSLAM